jgi:hypothetical protein
MTEEDEILKEIFTKRIRDCMETQYKLIKLANSIDFCVCEASLAGNCNFGELDALHELKLVLSSSLLELNELKNK